MRPTPPHPLDPVAVWDAPPPETQRQVSNGGNSPRAKLSGADQPELPNAPVRVHWSAIEVVQAIERPMARTRAKKARRRRGR